MADQTDIDTKLLNGLTYRLIDSLSQLTDLTDAWLALLADCQTPEPVLAPQFAFTWWQHYGNDRSLAVMAFFSDGKLVGLAPLCKRNHRYTFGLVFSRLEFIGASEADQDGVWLDYLNLIAKVGYEQAVAEAFIIALTEQLFGKVDECVLEMMDGDAQITALIEQAAQDVSLECDVTHAADAAYIKLPADWETYMATLPKKKRYSLRSARRDFELWLQDRTARMHTATDAESLRKGMAILRNLHSARWQQQGQPGAFSYARFVAFHEQYTRSLLDANKLRLQWLTVDDEPVAALYQFVGENKIYFYQNGRQMGLPNKVRIGIVILMMAIEQAMERGIREFDLLAGDARYKKLFANASRPLMRQRLVVADSGKERLLQTVLAAARFRRALLGS